MLYKCTEEGVCRGFLLRKYQRKSNLIWVMTTVASQSTISIIGLHKIKLTPTRWNTLAQPQAACGYILGQGWTISTFHLLSLSLPLSNPVSLFPCVCLTPVYVKYQADARCRFALAHMCQFRHATPREGREAIGGQGQWDRVCNMVGCDVTAFTIDFFPPPAFF